MKFGIIAAGEGSRLANEGVLMPKPLVPVGGECLIDRLLRIFRDNGASEIVVICNDLLPYVDAHLCQVERDGLQDGSRVPLRHIVKTTPSSMHSFYELSNMLDGDEPFIVTTVDTFFDEEAFTRYVTAFAASKADGMMAVTDYVDDEKPLWVGTDGHVVNGFYDSDADHKCRYISAGIYGLRASALTILRRCIEEGQSRMRNFQRALVAGGLHLEAFPLGKVFDIDHASDIPTCVLGIYRHKQYSPGKSDADAQIMDRVLELLKENKGNKVIRTVSEEELMEKGQLPVADIYMSMARSPKVLAMLKNAQGKVVNAPRGVEACNLRAWMMQDMCSTLPCWVKRADGCAEEKADTVFCQTEEERDRAIGAMKGRGIRHHVVQVHYEGDLIKFYGVSGTDFFHWSYPAETGQTKFGLEENNSALHRYAFSVRQVKAMADEIAYRYNVPVYGGDAVVSPDGSVNIIDFNDWPSFSPCWDEAARAIAGIVLSL